MERVESRIQGGQTLLEAGGVEVAVLEGVLVALDRVLGSGDLLGERSALFRECGPVGLVALGGLPAAPPSTSSLRTLCRSV